MGYIIQWNLRCQDYRLVLHLGTTWLRAIKEERKLREKSSVESKHAARNQHRWRKSMVDALRHMERFMATIYIIELSMRYEIIKVLL